MRRILSLLVVLLFTVPVGISLSGCGKAAAVQFCDASSGIRIGQITNITLNPQFYGLSLSYGQTQTVSTPTSTDCKGNSVTQTTYTFHSSDTSIIDVNPTTGALCAGTWNRNTPGGVADFSFCTPSNITGVSQITASANGAGSNKIPVYAHPVINSFTIGNPCTTATDPSSNCTSSPSSDSCPTPNVPVTAQPYDGTSCISQRDTRQIVFRAFDTNGNNITCAAGHPTFTLSQASGTASTGSSGTTGTTGTTTPNVVIATVDPNGVATAQLPGAAIVVASLAKSSSNAGFFSVCPPTNITVSSPNTVNGAVTITPNTPEPLNVTATDKNGVALSGLNLTYTSTTPTTTSANSTGITATFPSAAAIDVFCQPPACNPSPTSTFGINGNGKPVSSNTIVATAAGNNSTILYAASTQSQYFTAIDFNTNAIPTPTRLPYVPNSMVLTQDGNTIYMGSDAELMTITAATNSVSGQDTTVRGRVLAAAPDNSSIVVTDPTIGRTVLYAPATASATTAAALASHSGIALRAQYAPDSQTTYIIAMEAVSSSTPEPRLLVYSTNTGWTDEPVAGGNDVVPAIPSVGAFVASDTAITGYSYCANTNVTPTNYYPVASTSASGANRLVATNDGKHVLGLATAASGGTPTLTDVALSTLPSGPCPASTGATFTATPNPVTVSSVTAGACTTDSGLTFPYGVCANIAASSDSATAFITYPAAANATANGTLLPAYKPVTGGGPGTLSYVTLANGATAPVAGVFSTDNNTFFVGTSGDGAIHLITRSTLTDTRQVNPKLPTATSDGVTSTNPNGTTGTFAAPNLLVQKPRPTT